MSGTKPVTYFVRVTRTVTETTTIPVSTDGTESALKLAVQRVNSTVRASEITWTARTEVLKPEILRATTGRG